MRSTEEQIQPPNDIIRNTEVHLLYLYLSFTPTWTRKIGHIAKDTKFASPQHSYAYVQSKQIQLEIHPRTFAHKTNALARVYNYRPRFTIAHRVPGIIDRITHTRSHLETKIIFTKLRPHEGNSLKSFLLNNQPNSRRWLTSSRAHSPTPPSLFAILEQIYRRICIYLHHTCTYVDNFRTFDKATLRSYSHPFEYKIRQIIRHRYVVVDDTTRHDTAVGSRIFPRSYYFCQL